MRLSVVVAGALHTPFGHESSLVLGELASLVSFLCKYPLICDWDGVFRFLNQSPSAHLFELG